MTITIGFWVYVVLGSIALFPPLFGIKPFTYLIAHRWHPAVVQTTMKFRRTCLILNYLWFFVFVICALLSCLTYSTDHALNATLQNGIPALFQVVIALPLTLIGQKWIPQLIYEPNHFESVHDLFALMPYGLNLRYAKKIKARGVVQFQLTGREPLEGFLRFDTRTASFEYGTAENPTCTVHADSDLWLAIANNEIDAIEQSIARNYTTTGDSSIMLHLMPLFTTQWRNDYPIRTQSSPQLYSEYESIRPLDKRVKKAVVFYSGERSDEVSKTFFMAEHVMKGLQSEQVEVECVRLKQKEIKPCLGCFQCWTSTPGRCVHQDDMEELLHYFDEVDLMIFATPLYVFSVNGRMKSFLDRMIPRIQPYMAFDERGNTYHPCRQKAIPPIVVISAGGFPEVAGNFDGIRTLFRDYAHHMEGCTLRGELLLPAAEYLSINTFAFRKERIAHDCEAAGHALATMGYVPTEIMRSVSDIGMEKSYFGNLANKFWKHLDGNVHFLKYIREEREKEGSKGNPSK